MSRRGLRAAASAVSVSEDRWRSGPLPLGFGQDLLDHERIHIDQADLDRWSTTLATPGLLPCYWQTRLLCRTE